MSTAVTTEKDDRRAAPPRPERKGGRRLGDQAAGWSFAAPSTLLVLGFSLLPMGWAFRLSLTDSDLVSEGQGVGFANYRTLADDPVFWKAIRNTLELTGIYIPVSLLLGLGVALLLNKPIRGIGFYRACFLVPFVASAAAEGLLMAFVFDKDFGVVNGLVTRAGLPAQGFLDDPSQALLVISGIFVWTQFGFNVVIYLAALQEIPKEVLEAAAIDGAGAWRTFRHIIVPSVRPISLFLAVWGLIDCLQFFDLLFTTTKGGPVNSTITIVYYVWQLAFEFFTAGYGAAVAYALFAGSLLAIVVGLVFGRKKGFLL
ncbi:carbohydrate ABC transporter permease [Actinomadura chibensis]|uniref:Sugar ABC transporter permease n=1 Tax=Actinomadura chibensis TaxID=392828 RepID=A0A5D0N1R5_9ACTN|nr:sugar ABC transporter permease [Actinomadura chibensis]TYB38387.1 sugar ABC transporter permease [Actinomadura chibensis]